MKYREMSKFLKGTGSVAFCPSRWITKYIWCEKWGAVSPSAVFHLETGAEEPCPALGPGPAPEQTSSSTGGKCAWTPEPDGTQGTGAPSSLFPFLPPLLPPT